MHLIKQLVAVSALFSLAGIAGAAQVDLSKLPPPASRQGVTYEKDIKPILEASCFRCHGPEKPKAGLRLDSREGVLKGGKEGKVIAEGNSAKSLLVVAVSQLDPELSMPPKPRPGRRGQGGGDGGSGGPPGGGKGHDMGPPPKPLTPEQVGLVRAWIDQGAK